MIVSGAKMHVTMQLAVFAPDNHQHLCMGFVTDHAIYHVRANVFQAVCPIDVCFFIETCQ